MSAEGVAAGGHVRYLLASTSHTSRMLIRFMVKGVILTSFPVVLKGDPAVVSLAAGTVVAGLM